LLQEENSVQQASENRDEHPIGTGMETLRTFYNAFNLPFSQCNYSAGRVDRERHRQGPAAKERDGSMVFRLPEIGRIENPRGYAPREVENLRSLLLAGVEAEQDSRREHFYNLEAEKSAYYIHVSPITGSVMLLAKWCRQSSNCYAAAGQQVA
jgi:hypothetical protein